MSKEAIAHYEAALKEAFPTGATGDVFYHWNEARKALDEDQAHYKKVIADVQALFEAKREQQEPVSDRENAIIRFALHQFMSNAYAHLNAAAQDKEGRRYRPDAAEKFAKDAKDAEALLGRLQFKSPPASKPWVGLTDEELTNMAAIKSGLPLYRAIEEELKARNT